MFAQIAVFLVETVFGFFVFMLLTRFHFQWLRVSFRNPVGEFVLATTNWMVMPARRVIPGLAGLDLATLLLAWLLQALGHLAAQRSAGAIRASPLSPGVAAVDLLRYSLYILVFALIVQLVLSWVNPYAPLAPVFDTRDAAVPAADPPLHPADRQHRPLAGGPGAADPGAADRGQRPLRRGCA